MRRRVQFSLRTLLITLTVIGVALGIQANRVRRQREAVQVILSSGGTVQYDYQTDHAGSIIRL